MDEEPECMCGVMAQMTKVWTPGMRVGMGWATSESPGKDRGGGSILFHGDSIPALMQRPSMAGRQYKQSMSATIRRCNDKSVHEKSTTAPGLERARTPRDMARSNMLVASPRAWPPMERQVCGPRGRAGNPRRRKATGPTYHLTIETRAMPTLPARLKLLSQSQDHTFRHTTTRATGSRRSSAQQAPQAATTACSPVRRLFLSRRSRTTHGFGLVNTRIRVEVDHVRWSIVLVEQVAHLFAALCRILVPHGASSRSRWMNIESAPLTTCYHELAKPSLGRNGRPGEE